MNSNQYIRLYIHLTQGTFDTPSGQAKGPQALEYALIPFHDSESKRQAIARARQFSTPLQGVTVKYYKGFKIFIYVYLLG